MHIRIHKALVTTMLFVPFGFVSCFDDKYDLGKDIDMSVTVESENLVVPLGYSEVATLDKIIDESETLKLGEDSIYAFKKKDAIDDVHIDVDAVNISVDNPTIDPIEIDFGDETDIDPFHVDLADPSFQVSVEDIEVNDDALPDVDIVVEQPLTSVPNIAVNQTFTLGQHKDISLQLNTSSFKDVDKVKTVYFGDGQHGQLVDFEISISTINKLLQEGSQQRLEELTVNFPEGFVLSPYPGGSSNMTINGNVVTVKNVDLMGLDELKYQFYVDRFEHEFDVDHLMYEGRLDFSLKYSINGTFVSTPGLTGNFVAGLSAADKFQFDKAAVVTKDVEVGVDNGEFHFTSDIDGLSDLKSVKKISFENQSVFYLNLNQLTLPFDFHDSSVFVIQIPDILRIHPISMPQGVRYDEANHQLVVPANSLTLSDNDIQLGLDEIDFTVDYPEGKLTENGVLSVNETLTYYAQSEVGGQVKKNVLVVKGGKTLYTDELSGLNRTLILTTDCGTAGTNELRVENAMVVANSVSADVNSSADFEVCEEDMPKEVRSLKEVYLENNQPAKFTLKVDFHEMPKDIKKGIVMDPLTVNLPKFIVFGNNPEIDENNVMTLNESFVPCEANHYTYIKEVEVFGMDFTKIEEYAQKGLTIGEDRVLRVPSKYTEVAVEGTVRTGDGEEVNSKNFENFKIYPTIDVEDMTIGKVVGQVDPDIDPVEEMVDLDLDDDLDFLKDENNELHIENPVINVKLVNNVGVPVNLNLEITGHKYGQNQCIEGSRVTASTQQFPEFKLYPAQDREHPVTTHIFISRKPVALGENSETDKYVNVVLSEATTPGNDLSNLLVHLPDQVKFTLNAEADQSQVHEVDIAPNFVENGEEKARFLVTGDYDVTVPLKFEALDITYEDSVDNLNEDLWDFLDVALGAEMHITANLTNQIPADLQMKAFAKDWNGKELKSIQVKVFVDDVEDGVIPGVTVEGQKVTKPIRIELKAHDSEELKRLDKLCFTVGAVIEETKNGLPLKGNQSIQVTDVKAHVKKIDLDLN